MPADNIPLSIIAGLIGLVLLGDVVIQLIRERRARRRLHDTTVARLRAQQALDRVNDRS